MCLEKGYSGREVRYALMRVHYRAPLNFTWEGMEEARQSLGRIDEWLRRLRESGASRARADVPSTIERRQILPRHWMTISTSPRRWGILFEQIRESNRELDARQLIRRARVAWLEWWEQIDRVLALAPEAGRAARGNCATGGGAGAGAACKRLAKK